MGGDGRMQVARAEAEAEGGNAEAECRRARQLQFAHVLARAASVQNTTCTNACPKDSVADDPISIRVELENAKKWKRSESS